MELPPIQQQSSEQESVRKDRVIGSLTLGLIFLAGATFSWSYFADAAPQNVQPEVAAVTTSQETPLGPDPFASASLAAKSAIVVDETSGRVLFELNPDTQLPLASLTKVPLMLVVSQMLPGDALITMPKGVPQFLTGTRWKVSDIADFTLAISSNGGADVLANAAAERIIATYPDAPGHDATVWRMNGLAREIGLANTYFLNDNGLDESPTQSGAYGTARDMAKLFAYAASTSPQTFSATTRQSFTITSTDGSRATAINTDEALPAISGFIMGKTGYTDLAGGNLAIVFDHGSHRIVAVVLGSTHDGRFEDMKTLVALTDQAIAVH